MTVAERPRPSPYVNRVKSLGEERFRRETRLTAEQDAWLIREADKGGISASHMLRNLVEQAMGKAGARRKTPDASD